MTNEDLENVHSTLKLKFAIVSQTQTHLCVCLSSRRSALRTQLPGRWVQVLRAAVGPSDRRDAVWAERVVAVRGRKVYGRPMEEKSIAEMRCGTRNWFISRTLFTSPDNNLLEASFCLFPSFFNQIFGVSALISAAASSVVCVWAWWLTQWCNCSMQSFQRAPKQWLRCSWLSCLPRVVFQCKHNYWNQFSIDYYCLTGGKMFWRAPVLPAEGSTALESTL